MKRFPKEQFDSAKSLLRAIADKRGRLATLTNLVEAARSVVNSDDQRRSSAISPLFEPDQFAGAAELYRRTDDRTRDIIQSRYHFLLGAILEGPMPGYKPRRVDYSALPVGARCYFAAPFLDLVVGNSFPRLDLDHSDPQHRLVFIHTGGPADPDTWRQALPKLSAWLGGNWLLTGHTATTITLTHRDALPSAIPLRPEFFQKGALFVGIDTTSQIPTHIPLSDLSSGTLIVGAAGSGKSNATHVLMQSILANLPLFQAVFCIDGKEGMTFARYRNSAPDKLRVFIDEPDVWKLTAQLVTIARARNASLTAAGLDMAPNNFVAVIIEEMSNYTAKPVTDDKAVLKQHTQFIADLATLARRGRSAGLKILITAQSPDSDQVPTAVRSNCQTAIIFKLPVDVHATMMVGQIEPGRDPRKLTRGTALIKQDNGTLQAVQFPVVPPPGRTP